MKVTLAYPYTDEKGKPHKPDDTVDLDEAEATQLVRDGRARADESTKSSSKKQEG